MERLTKDWLAKSLSKYENRTQDDHRWGRVEAVNEDGSYMVRIGDGEPARCSNGCAANVGDVVFTVVTKDGLCVAICRLGGDLGGGFSVDSVYPVGSIYMSVAETNPSILFGGTWERLQNCFLLGASSTYAAGSTGGEAEHTLTVDEMPSHSHAFKVGSGDANDYLAGSDNSYGIKADNDGMTNERTYSGGLTEVGGSQPHNNMPPFLAVYMWKRIA